MRAWPLVLSFLMGGAAHAATVLCGEVACTDATTTQAPWPGPMKSGVPITAGPKVAMRLPEGFSHVSQFRTSVTFFYPSKKKERRAISVMSVTLRDDEKSGPAGGWKTLYRTARPGLQAYYFRDRTRDSAYTAIIRNTAEENRRHFPSLTYLELTTTGLNKDEFLGILGSVHPVDTLFPTDRDSERTDRARTH